MDVLNRKTLTVFNPHALNGIMDGCASVAWPYTTEVKSQTSNLKSQIPPKYYSLSGLLLAGPTKKGLYIKDGRIRAVE